MKYTLDECLPTVAIEKAANNYNLYWQADSQYDACLILDENREYIEGFLDGCYKVFSINYSLPSRMWGHNSGQVNDIPQEVAEELESLIRDLLQGLVTARYENLKNISSSD